MDHRSKIVLFVIKIDRSSGELNYILESKGMNGFHHQLLAIQIPVKGLEKTSGSQSPRDSIVRSKSPEKTRPLTSALDHVSREKSRRRAGIKQVARAVVMIITLEVRLRYYFRVFQGLAWPARNPCTRNGSRPKPTPYSPFDINSESIR